MSSRQRPKTIPFINRSILQNGETGVAVGIPGDVCEEVGGLEAGRGGDVVDAEYDREDNTLTIFLPDNRDE